jgi:hypothetical protein
MKRISPLGQSERNLVPKRVRENASKKSLVNLKDISSTSFNKEKYKSMLRKMESKTESELFEGMKVQGMTSARLLRRQPSQTTEEPTDTVLKTVVDVSDFHHFLSSQRSVQKKFQEPSIGKFINESFIHLPKVRPKVTKNSASKLEGTIENSSKKSFLNPIRVVAPSSSGLILKDRDKKVRGRQVITHLSQGSCNKEAEFDQNSNTCKVVNKGSWNSHSKENQKNHERKITVLSKTSFVTQRRHKAASASHLPTYSDQSAVGNKLNAASEIYQVNQNIKDSVSLLFKNVVFSAKRSKTPRSIHIK